MYCFLCSIFLWLLVSRYFGFLFSLCSLLQRWRNRKLAPQVLKQPTHQLSRADSAQYSQKAPHRNFYHTIHMASHAAPCSLRLTQADRSGNQCDTRPLALSNANLPTPATTESGHRANIISDFFLGAYRSTLLADTKTPTLGLTTWSPNSLMAIIIVTTSAAPWPSISRDISFHLEPSAFKRREPAGLDRRRVCVRASRARKGTSLLPVANTWGSRSKFSHR